MTPRSSVRAAAHEIYSELAKKGQAVGSPVPPPSLSLPHSLMCRTRVNPSSDGGGDDNRAAAPDPPSLGYGGASPPSPSVDVTDLTARVRALYEDSAVPVAEIARLCGVTERTVYKYAAKGGWAKRTRRGEDSAPQFAPLKGAGGRFIRRADKDQPRSRTA